MSVLVAAAADAAAVDAMALYGHIAKTGLVGFVLGLLDGCYSAPAAMAPVLLVLAIVVAVLHSDTDCSSMALPG